MLLTSNPWLYALQWTLLAFFLIPLFEAVMMVVGSLWARFGYAEAPGKHHLLIIQLTTVGKEFEMVQRSIDALRSYNLTMPHQIWVAIEPGYRQDYVGADRVIVVSENFKCKPIDKARALEFTRRLRVKLGLNRADVKILLADDDTLPSEAYIYKAFKGDYDVCQGVTVPNRWYAVGGWRHFLLSHMDNIRTRNCLIYCSCTQGVTQKPLFVHGEGLCITGRAEDIVTWDRHIVASDDLVFGTNAARMGLSWGYFQAAIQLVSPWTFRENLNQRWRWTWGNIDAIRDREIMPLGAAIFKAFKYILGFVSIIASTSGAVLLWFGVAKVPPQAHAVFWVSLACWAGSYALSGYINAGGQPNRKDRTLFRFWLFRIGQTIAAGLLTPVSAITPIFVIVYSLARGRPKKFIMIDKFNKLMDKGKKPAATAV